MISRLIQAPKRFVAFASDLRPAERVRFALSRAGGQSRFDCHCSPKPSKSGQNPPLQRAFCSPLGTITPLITVDAFASGPGG